MTRDEEKGEAGSHRWVGEMSSAAFCSECGLDYRDGHNSWCVGKGERRAGHSRLHANKDGSLRTEDPNPPKWEDDLEAGIAAIVRGLGDVCKALNRRHDERLP